MTNRTSPNTSDRDRKLIGKNLFLSYARGDDEPFVKRLYEDLDKEGFNVWWDRERMPNRGLTFLQEIRDAVEQSDRLIAVVGPTAIKSDYVRAEWKHALLFAKGVVPILRMGARHLIPEELRGDDYKLLPEELADYHCPDFREDGSYAKAFQELVRVLREPVPPLGPFLTSVPALPPHFLPRAEDFMALEQSVLADIHRPVVITSARQAMAIYGMGGIGKSVMAAAFARSAKARRSFTDGILWLSIGQEPNLLRTLNLIGQAFQDSDLKQCVEIEAAKARLPGVLEPRDALIVLDDVWAVKHVTPLTNALGPRCRLIVTTRDGSIATSLGAQERRLDALSDEAAQAFLANWAGVDLASLPAVARDVSSECGNLPLALALCGAMARDGTLWSDILSALQRAELTFVEAELPNYEHRDVLRAMQSSVDMLGKEDPLAVERYLDLTVFHEDKAVPESAVITLWSRRGLMTEGRARKLITTLSRRSLLRIDSEPSHTDNSKRMISLHDLQRDYLLASSGGLSARSRALLDAYWEKCQGGWWTGPLDGYFHLRLMRHLSQVEGDIACRSLLLDYRWIEAKLRHTDVNALLDDFSYGGDHAPLAAINQALHQAAHILAHADGDWSGPDQLASQCLARLSHRNEPEITQLCSDAVVAQTARGVFWLRPLAASLQEPSALLRTLVGHNNGVTALAILPDGRLVSASGDTTIKVWNLTSGNADMTLVGHEGVVWALAPLTDGRLASGSGNEAIEIWAYWGWGDPAPEPTKEYYDIRIWNLASGETEWTLTGHPDNVWALVTLPDGRLISGSRNGTFILWDLTAMEGDIILGSDGPVKPVRPVSGLALLTDGRLASISWGTIAIHDLETGESQNLVEEYHGTLLVPLAALPEGRLAVGRHDNTIGVLNLAGVAEPLTDLAGSHDSDGDPILRDQLFESVLQGHSSWVSALALMPDGRLASGAKDGTIKLWNLATREAKVTLEGHSTRVSALAPMPDGRLASASEDGTIKLWSVTLGEGASTLDRHLRPVRALTLLPDGRLASGSDDRTIKLWSLETARPQRTLMGHSESVRALALLPDGKLLSGSWDGTIKVWDIAADEIEVSLDKIPYLREVNAFALLPDGRFASANGDKTIRLCSPKTGEVEMSLEGHLNYVLSLVPLPDGRLVSGSGDFTIKLWDLETGQVTLTLEGHVHDVSTLAVLPDGRLASGSWDGTIRVWNMESGESEATLVGHKGTVWAIALLPDGRIVSGSRDRTIRVWSERDNRWSSAIAFASDTGITALAFDEASSLLAAGDASGRVHFLSVQYSIS